MSPPWREALQSADHSIPLGFMLVFSLLHRALINSGFVLARSWRSTDLKVMLLMVFLITVWTTITLFSAAKFWNSSNAKFVQKAITVPWMAQIFVVFWLIDRISVCWYAEARRTSESTHGFWKLECPNGPFGWTKSLHPVYRRTLFATIALVVIPFNATAIYYGEFVSGMLNMTGLFLFSSSAFSLNSYAKARHICDGEMLRVALGTSHLEGTMYILPSRKAGFEAVWSPKIPAEHDGADTEIMPLFGLMRTGIWPHTEPLQRLRNAMSLYNRRAELSQRQVIDLAEWLQLEPTSVIAQLPLRAKRPVGVHLIGRDLMYALCHAEYLVFMNKTKLPLRLQRNLGTLREMKRSGGSDGGDSSPAVGFAGGIAGYQDAVKYVYALFSEPMDAQALTPDMEPPPYSATLQARPESSIDYVDKLWTVCIQHTESTFSALYMFCCIVFIEVGNTAGFHIFPLRCQSSQGDVVTWQIVWRQGWYECILAQMVASSPLLAAAFAAAVI